jgi:hypothetical protein
MKLKILVAVAIFSAGLIASESDNPGRGKKPDKDKPVPATDVVLVKKLTSKGRPASPGGGKPAKGQTATGVLGQQVSGKRYAVVVGISDYPGTVNDLQYCDDDADAMSTALTEVYGFTGVTVLKDLSATRGAILAAIEDSVSQAGSDGEVVFFFSGHGANGVASDGDDERIDEAIVVCNNDNTVYTYIWDGELRNAFSGFATSRIIFIFDSCLAGGMQQDLQGPGRVIAMAAGEQGYSYETDALHNGEFTYYFVEEGMLGGKANIHDYDNDRTTQEAAQVTVEEAFDYCKSNCRLDKPCVGDYFGEDLLP